MGQFDQLQPRTWYPVPILIIETAVHILGMFTFRQNDENTYKNMKQVEDKLKIACAPLTNKAAASTGDMIPVAAAVDCCKIYASLSKV